MCERERVKTKIEKCCARGAWCHCDQIKRRGAGSISHRDRDGAAGDSNSHVGHFRLNGCGQADQGVVGCGRYSHFLIVYTYGAARGQHRIDAGADNDTIAASLVHPAFDLATSIDGLAAAGLADVETAVVGTDVKIGAKQAKSFHGFGRDSLCEHELIGVNFNDIAGFEIGIDGHSVATHCERVRSIDRGRILIDEEITVYSHCHGCSHRASDRERHRARVLTIDESLH